MSKFANSGELKTPVFFIREKHVNDVEGYDDPVQINVFGAGQAVKVKWVNAHGNETFTAMQLQLREPATLTCRYSPLISKQLIVYKAGDSTPYEIISADNVEEKNEWLEIKVQRREAAR